jgi:hypothetical protein
MAGGIFWQLLHLLAIYGYTCQLAEQLMPFGTAV